MSLESKVRSLYANIGKLITSSLELDEILVGIMKEVRNFFQPENWSLLRVDPNTNELFFLIFQGSVEFETVKDLRLKVGEGIAGSVAQSGRPIYVHDTSGDTRFSSRVDESTGFKTKSIIAVPMRFRDTIYGVIEIINGPDYSSFTEDEHLVLQTIADFSAIAFANAAMYESMLAALHNDPLTSCYNRAKLEEVIKEQEEASGHRREPDQKRRMVTIIIIDLNNFKEINDTYGHLEGDKVLKQTANALRKCVRREDMVFRIGGDEFMIVMMNPDEEHVGMAEDRVSSELVKVASSQSKTSHLAFSFGVASGPAGKIRSLIEQADHKMYEEKKGEKARLN